MGHPFGKVHISQMKKAEYLNEYGLPGMKGFQPESMELLDKIKALPVTDFLIVRAENENEDVKNLYSRLQNTFRRMMTALDLPFRIKCSRNRQKNHVVIWKEAKSQTAPRPIPNAPAKSQLTHA
jgi:hypothetical protein